MSGTPDQHAESVVVTVAFEFPYNCSIESIVNEVEREIRRHLFTYRFKVTGATVTTTWPQGWERTDES